MSVVAKRRASASASPPVSSRRAISARQARNTRPPAAAAAANRWPEWFGLKHTGYGYGSGWSAPVDKATDGRAQVIALGRLLASLEKGTDHQSWRRVAPATADYLAFIAANGYDLSDVEKRAAGLSKPKPARRARATKAVSASEPTAADGAGTGAVHDQDVTATEADDQDAQASAADDTSAA